MSAAAPSLDYCFCGGHGRVAALSDHDKVYLYYRITDCVCLEDQALFASVDACAEGWELWLGVDVIGNDKLSAKTVSISCESCYLCLRS